MLLTRSADERQAKHTSNIEDIRIWIDPDALRARKLAVGDVLGALRRAGGTRTLVPGDLYSALQCTPGGLTKMIARLERQGLVQRLTDADDARRAHIRLTPKGASIERKAGAEYLDGADRLLSKLSEDEIEQINAALALLLDCFEEEDT